MNIEWCVMCCSFCWRLGKLVFFFFFFQAEDGIRDLVRSRGLGDVYKRQLYVPGGKQITRIHGPFVSDDEVRAVADHWRGQGLSLIHI